MTGLTRSQHFVPRTLLRHFGVGPDRLVSIFDSGRNILRPPTIIERVLAENYFYDRDNLIEDFLAEKVEGPAAPIIESIISNPRQPLTFDRISLLRFICVQLYRTPSALATSLQLIEKFTGTIFQRLGELNNFDAETTRKVKLVLNNPKALLAKQTIEGALNWPLIEDLGWHVLVNRTARPFVISDNPVTQYNWYLRDSKDQGYAAFTKAGTQLFLPLSPDITLCLNDHAIYKIGAKGTTYADLTNVDDVNLLNELQIRNRDSFVVYSGMANDEYVKSKCSMFPAASLHQNHAGSSDPEDMEDGKLMTRHFLWRTQAHLNHWLSVCKIKRRNRKEGPRCYDRAPDVVKAHKIFMERVRNSARQRSAK